MVACGGDAVDTQDNVRRHDAEHNDLRHVHNLTRSRLGRLHARARTLRLLSATGFSLAPVLDRQSSRLISDGSDALAKVLPRQRALDPARGRYVHSRAAVGRGDLCVRWSVFGICRFYGRWLLLPWLFDRLQ